MYADNYKVRRLKSRTALKFRRRLISFASLSQVKYTTVDIGDTKIFCPDTYVFGRCEMLTGVDLNERLIALTFASVEDKLIFIQLGFLKLYYLGVEDDGLPFTYLKNLIDAKLSNFFDLSAYFKYPSTHTVANKISSLVIGLSMVTPYGQKAYCKEIEINHS